MTRARFAGYRELQNIVTSGSSGDRSLHCKRAAKSRRSQTVATAEVVTLFCTSQFPEGSKSSIRPELRPQAWRDGLFPIGRRAGAQQLAVFDQSLGFASAPLTSAIPLAWPPQKTFATAVVVYSSARFSLEYQKVFIKMFASYPIDQMLVNDILMGDATLRAAVRPAEHPGQDFGAMSAARFKRECLLESAVCHECAQNKAKWCGHIWFSLLRTGTFSSC
jgi:hypothetical protein